MRIVLPALPADPPSTGFPLLATLAPVAVSVGIWVVTGSAFALLFAALGPAVAIASLADGRRQRRRRARGERRRFLAEAAECRSRIDAVHVKERERAGAAARTASAILAQTRHDPDRWSAFDPEAVVVTLGAGRVSSSVTVDDPPPPARDADARFVRVRRELASRARFLDRAPVTAAGVDGIGVVGPAALALPVVRGYLAQVAALAPPDGWTVGIEGADAAWCAEFPHPATGLPAPAGEGCLVVSFTPVASRRPGERAVVVALAPTRELLPPGVRVVVESGAGGAVLARHPGPATTGALEVETVGLGQAVAAARWLAALATEDRGYRHGSRIPDRVDLGDLLAGRPAVGEPGRSALRCSFVVDSTGAREVDLVDDGPHAIVGGTTGSGKSELLISWVVSLAAALPPRLLTVLLVDFKGGSSFAGLAELPHCVGVISDLDETAAMRALASLRAELRHRERVLAARAARSIDELPIGDGDERDLARLVIVVDEFAAMVALLPDLHALFADIAARGRSLGVHLILGTQRPAGVVRDAVLANSGLRVSLRVNNRSDSTAVIGDDSAASLPAGRRGRAMLSAAGAEPVEVQVAIAAPADVRSAAERWTTPADRRVRRPWLEPLPLRVPFTRVRVAAPGPGHLPFALADRPHEQSQPVIGYSPAAHGHLLVLGAGRSGKSTLICTLLAGADDAGIEVMRASGVDDSWDLLESLTDRLRAGEPAPGRSRLLVLDDFDILYSRVPGDYQSALAEMLAALLREGASVGLALLVTAQRIPPALATALSGCGTRVLLRHSSKQDYLLAGGAGDLHDPALPPGGGHWYSGASTERIQVAVTHQGWAAAPPARGVPATIDSSATMLVVSATPAETAARVRESASAPRVVELGFGSADPRAQVGEPAEGHVVIVGNPDAWQAHWGAVAALGQSVPVVYDGVSLADYRAISRSQRLPPPITRAPGEALVLLTRPDGTVCRARWS